VRELLIVYGTRPEIIKLSSIIRQARSGGREVVTVHTEQHWSHDLAGRFLTELQLPAPNYQLDARYHTPNEQIALMLKKLDPILARHRNSIVIVQGDTNSTLAGALGAKKRGMPVAHVEAGLRSYDSRMPEELNRVLVDHMANWLFPPTDVQSGILGKEGISPDKIHVVGNTIADVLRVYRTAIKTPGVLMGRFGLQAGGFALLTLHRQENVDHPGVLAGILSGIERIGSEHALPILWPIHPRTEDRIRQASMAVPDGVRLVPPLGYLETLQLQKAARLVLTDSGGLQEEAAILGVPCVTLRTSTERPETISIGSNTLAGVEPESMAQAARDSLSSSTTWVHPYGDGHTAERILTAIADSLAET
jgi:UDP-N-acetylglucosamine 2-epimerase (non-hydrolysing)